MDNFTQTISDLLKEKINAPLYLVFLSASIAWNWKYLYSLFFEDGIPEGTTRINYAQSLSHSINLNSDFIFLGLNFEPILSFTLSSIMLFFVPVVITYIAIYHLPILHGVVHKKSLKFHFERKGEYDRQNREYQKQRAVDLKEVERFITEQRQTTENIAKESNLVEHIKQSLGQEEIWETEFQALKKSAEFKNLKTLKDAAMSVQVNGYEMYQLAYAHVNNLADVNKEDRTISLTDKGKYFVKRFLEEQDQ